MTTKTTNISDLHLVSNIINITDETWNNINTECNEHTDEPSQSSYKSTVTDNGVEHTFSVDSIDGKTNIASVTMGSEELQAELEYIIEEQDLTDCDIETQVIEAVGVIYLEMCI